MSAVQKVIPSPWKWCFKCVIAVRRSSLDLSNTGKTGSSAGVSRAWRIRASQKNPLLLHRRNSIIGGMKLRIQASLLGSNTVGAILANTSWRNSARLSLFTLASKQRGKQKWCFAYKTSSLLVPVCTHFCTTSWKIHLFLTRIRFWLSVSSEWRIEWSVNAVGFGYWFALRLATWKESTNRDLLFCQCFRFRLSNAQALRLANESTDREQQFCHCFRFLEMPGAKNWPSGKSMTHRINRIGSAAQLKLRKIPLRNIPATMSALHWNNPLSR